jgi:hypothetical protein
VLGQFRLHRRRRVLVRHLQFDRGEAGGSGGAEPLHERALGEEIGEVGGEAGHSDHGLREESEMY